MTFEEEFCREKAQKAQERSEVGGRRALESYLLSVESLGGGKACEGNDVGGRGSEVGSRRTEDRQLTTDYGDKIIDT